MAIDKIEAAKRGQLLKKQKYPHRFAAVEHRVIDSPAFADLKPTAKVLLLLLARQLTKGWPVQTEHIDVGNRFGEVCHVAEYSLPPDAIAAAGDAGRQFVEDEREAMRNRLRRAA